MATGVEGESESTSKLSPGGGIVKWYSEDQGYGFIINDDGGRDLFVHHSYIAGDGFKTLSEGARVRFLAEHGPKGPTAREVVEVDGRPPEPAQEKRPVEKGSAISVGGLMNRISRALRQRSYSSPAALRAAVVPPDAVGTNRGLFHRAFNEAVVRLEEDGMITGWPTAERGGEWSKKEISRESVLAAIAEFDRVGRDETLAFHGFRRALDYVVVLDDREYDSKALYAVAYGLQYPHDLPLREQRGFSGGVNLTRKLERLGFRVKKLRAQADAALTREGARAWIVRAGQQGENEDLAREQRIVLIGWSALGEIGPETTRNDLKALIRATGEEREASISAQAGSIFRFIHEMQVGDLVVLPLQRDRGKASVGVIEGPFRYRPDGVFEDRDAHYQRPVTWLSWGLPYELFDSDLRSAFGAQGTVSEIRRPNPVQRLLGATGAPASQPHRERRVDEPGDGQPGKAESEPDQPELAANQDKSHPPYEAPSLPAIANAIGAAGLSISDRMLRRYHVALRPRGFVILAGISGGGKTWLAETYAAATDAALLVVPVAPNWTTNEDLLGYLNPIDGVYCHTPASRFLLSAAREHAEAQAAGHDSRPYHLVLDEMNLARVEHYFAKFLSAMEARERHGTWPIDLAPDLTVDLTPNLYVIGTVNVDETTYGFADKVYDRAQLVELEVPRRALTEHVDDKEHGEALMRVWDAIYPVAPFGFRVLDEVDAYVAEAVAHGSTWQEAVDDQLLHKVLPKIKGTDPKIGAALEELRDATREQFPLSHDKVTVMLTDFTAHGFASYF